MRTLMMITMVVGLLFLATGCATMIVGYDNTVVVHGLPGDATVTDEHGMNVPVTTTTNVRRIWNTVYNYTDSVYVVRRSIELRSNAEHIITIRTAGKEQRVHLFPKLSAGWFVLDLLTGTFFVDWYTGNWNHFDDIDYSTMK